MAEAETLMAQKRWPQALKILDKVAKHSVYSFQAKIYYLRGTCCKEMGKKDWAVEAYEYAVAKQPTNARYHYALATVLVGNNWDAARNNYVLAYQLNPYLIGTLRDSYLQDTLAFDFRMKRHYKQEILARKIIVEMYPDDPEKLEGLGNTYFYAKDYSKAIETLGKVLAMKGKHKNQKEIYQLLVEAYYQIGRLDRAYQAIQEGFKLDHRDASFNHWMGMIFKNRKLYKLAIYYFEKSLYPSASVPSLISLSQVYDELGNQTASKAYLDIADKLYEDNEWVLDELSRYYELRGNLGKALSLAKKSVTLDPEDWERLYRLHKLYAKQEEKNLARETLLQAIAFAPPEELSKLKRELRKE